jgi:FAD-dependent urate hydroxylase
MVATCRSLHRAGYDVSVVASAKPAPAHWSRSCAERLILVDPLKDEAGFIDGVRNIVEGRGYALLVPGSDASLLALSRNRAPLEPNVTIGLPPHETVLGSLDKLRLIELAPAAGLSIPRTVECAGVDDAVRAAATLGFPVLLKPRHSVYELDGALIRLGSELIRDADTLTTLVPKYGDSCLVQRVDPGDVVSFFGVAAGGRLLASGVSRYLRTWYPDAGNVAFAETVEIPDGLAANVTALIEMFGWEGIFELEMIVRESGEFSAIDLNPRPYGSLELAIRAGADLPAIWAAWLSGETVEHATARPGVRYRWEDAEIKHAAWQLARARPLRAASVLAPHRNVVHAHFRPDDPGPLVARAIFLSRVLVARSRASAPVVAELRVPNPTPRRRRRAAPSVPRPATSVVIVGAGPYGLSAAAHLRAAGVETHVFGDVMGFWRRHMPRGMMLRSRKRSSHIADPRRKLTIDDYERDTGRRVTTPSLTLEEFLGYARWFQRKAVPDVDPRRVEVVEPGIGGYSVSLEDGETVTASHVVVAAGLAPFSRRPTPFDSLAPALVSHAVDHADLGVFRGRRVLVVGGGQSALESAALLHEHGASAEVLTRAPSIYWLGGNGSYRRRGPAFPLPPTDVGGRVTGWIAAAPDAFRRLPAPLKPEVSFRCIRPAGAGWLRPRLEQVPITTGRTAVACQQVDGGIRVVLDDDSERRVDHVLLATGYQVDVSGYRFLPPAIVEQLELNDGYPRLRPGLEASLPRLHFLGAPAAFTFGPIMRFVVGTWYAAPALTRKLIGKPQPPLRLSF